MPVHTITYRFNGAPQRHAFTLEQPRLSAHEAAMHLLLLHLGDSENSLIMPSADDTAEEILARAELLGVTEVEVVTQR